ncbi:uncharacterized protein LOC126190684 [Schistocerca cancellata]|uniref:uncharacterized protein LOC126190684 n=1 Tax=Schistocerca cancellata TaxID=274614 RepID=UPI0021199AF2|nr:uncharacterized protein LOC126190684 [Schistocerca cancellata]
MSSHELLRTPEEIIREFERQEAENVYYSESDEDVSESEDSHITDDHEDDEFNVPPFEVDSSDEGDSQLMNKAWLCAQCGCLESTKHAAASRASRAPTGPLQGSPADVPRDNSASAPRLRNRNLIFQQHGPSNTRARVTRLPRSAAKSASRSPALCGYVH